MKANLTDKQKVLCCIFNTEYHYSQDKLAVIFDSSQAGISRGISDVKNKLIDCYRDMYISLKTDLSCKELKEVLIGTLIDEDKIILDLDEIYNEKIHNNKGEDL